MQGKFTEGQRARLLECSRTEASCLVDAQKYLGLWLHARKGLGYRWPSLREQGAFFEVALEYARQFVPTPKGGWVDKEFGADWET